MRFDDEWPLMMEREAGMPEHVAPVSVGFGLHPVVDAKASAKAGHEVYKDVEYVRICVPGDRLSDFFQPSNEDYRRRFPRAYASFKAREGGEAIEGMRIEQWPAISRSLVLTLKAMHIHTVEGLASVHEGHIDKLGSGGRELRDKARAWLASAKDNAETMRLAAEKKQLEDQLAAMQAQILALQEQANDREADKPRRGRPPKSAEAAYAE